jgi:hypothetical protein
MQIGFGKTNSAPLSDCLGRSSLTNFWEYKIYDFGTMYHCAWLDGEPLVLEAPRRYSVLRRASSSTGNETTWGAFLDGERKLSMNILYDGAEQVYAGGELDNCTTCQWIPDGAMHGCIACAGSTPWQRTSSEGSVGWVDIGAATNVNTDGDWAIGGPLPGDFIIHHYN